MERFESTCEKLVMMAAVVFFVCSCANTQAPTAAASMTPEQRLLHESNQRFSVTIEEGAAVGAIAGAALGLLAGKPLTGGAAAAGIGAIAGGVAGYLLAEAEYRDEQTESNYNAAVDDVNKQVETFLIDARRSEIVAYQAQDASVCQLKSQNKKLLNNDTFDFGISIKDIKEQIIEAKKMISTLISIIDVTHGDKKQPFIKARHDVGFAIDIFERSLHQIQAARYCDQVLPESLP